MINAKGVEQMVGSPGTWSGMALRVSQCVFAAASVCAMVTAFGFSGTYAFRYMNTMMLFQIMWNLGLACLDIYGMRNRKDLHGRALVIVLVVGDWIMASLTFTAASASAGAATLYVGDVDFCRKVACGQIVLSIVLPFTATLLETISAFFMLSLAVSFS